MKERAFYRNEALENGFWEQICDLAHRPGVSEARRGRLLWELGQVFKQGKGTLFALVGELVDFSLDLGYPLSFRGRVGNLALAHAMGLAQTDPEELGISREEVLGSAGFRVPHITLNVAHAVYPQLAARLEELLPDCQVLWGGPDQPDYRVTLVPGEYDPDKRYLSLDIYCHTLLDQVGDRVCSARRAPTRAQVLDPAFLRWIWQEGWEDTVVLQDLWPLKETMPHLAPESLEEYITALDLALGPEERLADADEDLSGLGAGGESTYPRCQLAEYLIYALTLAWLEQYGDTAP